MAISSLPRPTEVPQAPCFGRITLSAPRVVTIRYDRRRVNAGDVLGALTAAGLGIVDVSTQEPDLEDVFQIGRATSGLQSLMRSSCAVFCLKKNTHTHRHPVM